MMPCMCKKVVIFDLDDTLYKEIDFLKSGYRKVAELVAKQYGVDARVIYEQLRKWYYNGDNAFACMNEEYGFGNPINEYLDIYRYHHPTLTLSAETEDTLSKLKEEGRGVSSVSVFKITQARIRFIAIRSKVFQKNFKSFGLLSVFL